ncbi:MAG: class I SAM-dependent methyltransferase [Pseudomonadota bacterium]
MKSGEEAVSWHPVWEEIFRSRPWGQYPPEELIRFVARVFYGVPDRAAVRILELGCGPGANMWYMAREGFSVYGVDGSPTAVALAGERLRQESLTADLRVGDIVELGDLYTGLQFSAIIDVVCLQCNRLCDVQRIVEQALDLLKPSGKFFAMMIAHGSVGCGTGVRIEEGTFDNITEGPFAGTGLNHFFTLKEIELLFRSFSDLNIEYTERSLRNRTAAYKFWLAEATK